jgi:hypothetical protein
LKRALPHWLFLAGVVLIIGGGAMPIGTATEMCLTTLSCVLFGIGSGLAIENLYRSAFSHSSFIAFCLNTFAFVCFVGLAVVLYVYFSQAAFESFEYSSDRGLMPLLVDRAQKLHSEPKRRRMAQDAYTVFGTQILYKRDDASEVLYSPNADDKAAWNDQQETMRSWEKRQKDAEEWLRKLIPNMVLGTAVFLVANVGTIWWLAFRPRRREADLATAAALASRSTRGIL